MITVIQTILFLVAPYLLIKNRTNKFIKTLGPIAIAYAGGLFFSLVVFILKKLNIEVNLITDVSEIGSYLAIGIAIPLLLFSVDLRELKKLTKPMILAFSILIVSVTITVITTYYAYGRTVENGRELSAMAAGLYTGGTPNLNAIGSFFRLDSKVIALANLSDMIVGAVLYAILLTIAKPFFKLFLKEKKEKYVREEILIDDYENKIEKIDHKPLVKNFFIALFMVIIGALIGVVIWFLGGAKDGLLIDILVPSLMLAVTIFGIAGSFIKKIRNVKGNTVLGQYLILVFSFALASSVDLASINQGFVKIFLLYAVITFGILLVDLIISKIFDIDVDCTLVAITAGIYGPAFVPALTQQIKNDDLCAPGLICGALGYAIGTFLGIFIACVTLF